MKISQTDFSGCLIIEPAVWEDERGYFMEVYKKNKLSDFLGYEVSFVQDNESTSKYGVLRGLHIQKGNYPQSKLVRVLHGKILDIAVDVRKNSPTFGKHFSIELSAENKKQLFIPHGFLHGFSVLSETATVLYKCDAYYHSASEDGCFPLDPTLEIDWKLPTEQIILSDKDKNAQPFHQFQPYEK